MVPSQEVCCQGPHRSAPLVALIEQGVLSLQASFPAPSGALSHLILYCCVAGLFGFFLLFLFSFLLLSFSVLRIGPWAAYVLGKSSTAEPHP